MKLIITLIFFLLGMNLHAQKTKEYSLESYPLTPGAEFSLAEWGENSVDAVTLSGQDVISVYQYDERLVYRFRDSIYSFDYNIDVDRYTGDMKSSHQWWDFDEDGLAELIIFSHVELYGTGGGTTHTYLKIISLKTATCLFDEEIYYTEEAFGKYGNKAYIHECGHEFSFLKGELLISKLIRLGFPKDECSRSLKPGRYILRENKFVWFDE